MSYLRTADVAMGNLIFGSYAGFRSIVGGKVAIKKSRLLSDHSIEETPRIQSMASEFQSKGYVNLGNPYSEELINTIQEKFDKCIDKDECSEPWGVVDGEIYSRRLKREKVLDCVPELANLLTDEIKKIACEYYGSPIQIRDVIAYRNNHIPPEVVEGTEAYNDHWHCDGTTIDHTKLFVCLNDVTENHGPFHIVSVDDTKRVAKRELVFDREKHGVPGGLVEELSENLTMLTGSAGSAMLGNTQLALHRAGVPDKGNHRDLVQFYIAPAREPLSENWSDSPPGARSARKLLRPIQY